VSDQIKRELDSALDEALNVETHHNERVVSWVRLIVLTLTNVVGVLSHPKTVNINWWEGNQGRMMLAWLAAAVFIAVLLRVRWKRYYSFVIPTMDGLALAAVLSNGQAIMERSGQEAAWAGAAAAAGCALYMVVGAIRLRIGATLFAGLTGLGIYIATILPFTTSGHFTSTAAMLGLAGLLAWLTVMTQRLAKARRTRGMLSRFLPQSVVEAAHDDPLALLTQARNADVTVLFTDIRGFTAWSEKRSPENVMKMLNEVQGGLAAEVSRQGGTVDKFLGDGMLAFFEGAEHADRALAAAQGCLNSAERFAGLRIGAGLQSGEVVIGCLGQHRVEFTVLGDTVNTASRLESMTKDLDEELLAGQGVADRAQTRLRQVAEVPIRGRTGTMTVYSL